jgi:osomolarity two-component system, response regulator SSK1
MFERMKIRESARSRIPLLRSLSGSVIGSRSKSRGPKQPQHEKDPTPPLPPRPSLPDEKPPPSRESKVTGTTTPTTSTQPSIAVVDYDPQPSPSAPATPLPPTRHAPDSVTVAPAMQLRKVWVKRPNASATRVEVNSDDLVDNLRDVILLKYANSLGRTIDSPDITLKIVARDQLNATTGGHERVLGPEEPVGRTLDDHFPGGQNIEDALIIELAKGRTPRPSPRPGNHQVSYYLPSEHFRPDDAARDYFPPMPAQSPHMVQANHLPHAMPHSMTVLTTGQLPPLPSPGGQSRRYGGRPKYSRQHTSSPTIVHSSQPNGALIGTKYIKDIHA